MIKFLYITDNPVVAKHLEEVGVGSIVVDMEYIGKAERQAGVNSVLNFHTVDDVHNVKSTLHKAELIVRCNPIHDKTENYCSSEEEIDAIISNGADKIMLPYFKTIQEIKRFLGIVNKRVKTILLIETPEAVNLLDEILQIEEIKEVYIGLNDLSIGYKKKFLFELLADGTVERICKKLQTKGVKYGFGGLARIGQGLLKAERIFIELCRLDAKTVILSRSFYNYNKTVDGAEIRRIFETEISKIRRLERDCLLGCVDFDLNRRQLNDDVNKIVSAM